MYAGLLSSRPLPALNKGAENGSDEDDDDFEEEMAAYTPVTDSAKAYGDPYPLTDPSEAERRVETKEERAVRVFLEDPERSLKIFFTSYFIDKGLMWCVTLFFSQQLTLMAFQERESMRRCPGTRPILHFIPHP